MADRIRVASFNIHTSNGWDGRNHWTLRRRACAAAIRGFEADVVGLQEVRPNQLAYLRSAFPQATIVGAGRDADGGGEHASVLVASEGWQVESSETRWLSETPDRAGSRGWGADLPRVVTLVKLRRDTTVLGVANTHFDHASKQARERSASLLAEWLLLERDRPWVVLGDLNAKPNSTPLRTLAAASFTDTLSRDAGGTEHAFTGSKDRTRIDYVLIGPGVQVSSAWIAHPRPDGRLPSDHWPVLADLMVD
jgi:endonuclease/exonuclease/phosphatase family metal-dependent hydrolase